MYGCAYDLGVKNHYWKQQRRDPPYVRYCVHRAQMLRHFGVTPVIVFDGDRLPAKGGEEKERRDRRAECMRKGHEKMAVGDKDGAAFFFAQGLDVTPAMAHELIAALKREGFEFVVAPYEADAQIAALAQLGGGEKGVDVVSPRTAISSRTGVRRCCSSSTNTAPRWNSTSQTSWPVPRGARGAGTTRGAICGKKPRGDRDACRGGRGRRRRADGRPAGSEDDDAPAATSASGRESRREKTSRREEETSGEGHASGLQRVVSDAVPRAVRSERMRFPAERAEHRPSSARTR